MNLKKNKISHLEKSKIQATGGATKKKILLFLIIIGAVFGSIAPFVHIAFPKVNQEVKVLNTNFKNATISEEEFRTQKQLLYTKYQVFGFSNMRRFTYAIGMPIALFCASLYIFFIVRYVSDKYAIIATLLTGFAFMFTAVYFIIWTLWAYTYKEEDFSESAYYASMIISSLLISITIFYYSLSKSNYDLKIKELVHLVFNARKGWYSTLEKHEHEEVVKNKKSKFDDNMYEIFEKVSK